MEPLTVGEQIMLLLLDSEDEKNSMFDPVRIMKGMFILTKEIPTPLLDISAEFDFVPYLYGPYSNAVKSSLRRLVSRDYVQELPANYYTWSYTKLSPKGRDYAANLRTELDPRIIALVDAVRIFVQRNSFSELLRKVYHKYPSYAVNSIFQD